VPDAVSTLIAALRQGIGTNQMMAYLVEMAVRLVELRRVLKPTGSIYLHCDPTASHYLRVLMDAVFGPLQFRNEIIWRRTGAHGAQKSFGPIHDTLLVYTKTDEYYFQVAKHPYMRGHVERRYKVDPAGRAKFSSGGNVLTGPGATKGESGQPWKGFDPSAKDRHWAIPGFLAEQMPPAFKNLGPLDKLDALYDAGLIDIQAGVAWPTPVRFLEPDSGQPLQDIWAFQPYTEGTVYGTADGIDQEVKWLGPTDPERLGYQTQKPLGLLERIIRSSCPVDGLILDPFCGCGTALVAAQKLGRRWIGIDITYLAIAVMRSRLKSAFKLTDIPVIGQPTEVEGARALAQTPEGRYQFQWWAVDMIGATPVGGVEKKGMDRGIDGKITFPTNGKVEVILVSVKSGQVSPTMLRDLKGTVEREKAAIGIFLTLEEPTKEMRLEADTAGLYRSELWKRDYPKIQILTIKELLDGKRPALPPYVMPNYQQAQRIPDKVGEQRGIFDAPPDEEGPRPAARAGPRPAPRAGPRAEARRPPKPRRAG
jgi:DNA modification methylase